MDISDTRTWGKELARFASTGGVGPKARGGARGYTLPQHDGPAELWNITRLQRPDVGMDEERLKDDR
jgi:hypothetical protein